MERLPDPPASFTLAPDVEALLPGQRLWRIYFRGGAHPSTWNEFRHYGPTGSRFDHHPPPAQTHRDHAIVYATLGSSAGPTVFAEVFQQTRVIDRKRDEPWLVAFDLTAPLQVLRTDRLWPIQAGGNMALNSGERARSRRWSSVIHASYANLQGIWYPSSLTNEPCLALYERAQPALPVVPQLNEPLDSPKLLRILTNVAADLGFALV